MNFLEKVVRKIIPNERDRIARTVRILRKGEQKSRKVFPDGGRKEFYKVNRDPDGYYNLLGGLDKTLEVVNNSEITVVLDVGAGTTRAINQIKNAFKDKLKNLVFKATILTRDPEIENELGFTNTILALAENLKKIPEKSVGLILSVWSITYSASPEKVFQSFDRVLAPGGIIKAFSPFTFFYRNFRYLIKIGILIDDGEKFYNLLKDNGYDVAFVQAEKNFGTTILAIKNGGDKKISAAKLLKEDLGDGNFHSI